MRARRRCVPLFLRLLDHRLREDSVAPGGIVYEDVCDGAHQLSVLHDRTSAHSLNDASALFDKPFVRHPDDHALRRRLAFRADLFDFYCKFFDLILFHRRENVRFSFFDLLRLRHVHRFAVFLAGQIGICISEKAVFRIFYQLSQGLIRFVKDSPDLAGIPLFSLLQRENSGVEQLSVRNLQNASRFHVRNSVT